jgi:hypothetical protein
LPFVFAEHAQRTDTGSSGGPTSLFGHASLATLTHVQLIAVGSPQLCYDNAVRHFDGVPAMTRHSIRKVTEARKNIFIRVLKETGSRAAAAAAASPHTDGGQGGRPGFETFRDLRKRDPEFALAVERAETEALGRVEAEIVKRAFTLDERPIFDRAGNKIGVQKDSRPANQMLMRLAEKLSPETWARRSKTEIEGRLVHQNIASTSIAVLEPADVLLLSEGEQDQLLDLIGKIEQRKTNPEAIDVQSSRVPAISEI